jgi:ABC-type branched-subunit amino acid transport system ATPase component
MNWFPSSGILMKGGVSILLVEQNVPLALQAAKRVYALQVGKVILEGDIDKFKGSEIVKRASWGG